MATVNIEDSPKKGFGIPKIDFAAIKNSPAFWPAIAMIVAVALCYWHLFKGLPDMWFEGDGYYSHGVLVPLISGYIIWKWWPRLKQIPVPSKPSWIALIPLAVTAWVLYAGTKGQQIQIISFSFVFFLLWGIWFAAGWKWMISLALPVLYLLFMLPIWMAIIDTYTNPLQIISTEVSYGMLEIAQFGPHREGSTTIHLNHFTLDVGVPCSGLKLVLAVSAFTIFFMMVARLKWWGNAIMLSAVLPLCLFINGLRIALIGVVGEMYGSDAGHQFHDYSGYITLLICFFLLFKLARFLGWND